MTDEAFAYGKISWPGCKCQQMKNLGMAAYPSYPLNHASNPFILLFDNRERGYKGSRRFQAHQAWQFISSAARSQR
jgi:hypothetical protein